jgi:hypothetical protein
VEALNKAYAGKGISFYYVLSREPHPGFYGFTQTDSLEMRQEYVRLANAELTLALPWIIDDMDNTMQKTYGRMPNADFIIDTDGKLLYSNEWANMDKLKDWLEANIGPSGIPGDDWAALGAADQTARAIGNNDEVPATEVPDTSLQALDVKRLDGSDPLPFSFEAATLPPNITAEGQSRLYFVVAPDTEKGISFDKSQVITVDFTEVKGIKFIKDQLQSGKRRGRGGDRDDKDIYPHTMGVLWTQEASAGRMEFKATVTASLEMGGGAPQKVTATYLVSGTMPESVTTVDEVAAAQVPAQLKTVTVQPTGDEVVPMDVAAKVDASNTRLYLYLSVDDVGGHHWNNLSAPPTVSLEAVSGVTVEKTMLTAGQHEGEGDKDDRILVVAIALEPGAGTFTIEVRPEAWICHDDEGWCRLFSKTYKITGK